MTAFAPPPLPPDARRRTPAPDPASRVPRVWLEAVIRLLAGADSAAIARDTRAFATGNNRPRMAGQGA